MKMGGRIREMNWGSGIHSQARLDTDASCEAFAGTPGAIIPVTAAEPFRHAKPRTTVLRREPGEMV